MGVVKTIGIVTGSLVGLGSIAGNIYQSYNSCDNITNFCDVNDTNNTNDTDELFTENHRLREQYYTLYREYEGYKSNFKQSKKRYEEIITKYGWFDGKYNKLNSYYKDILSLLNVSECSAIPHIDKIKVLVIINRYVEEFSIYVSSVSSFITNRMRYDNYDDWYHMSINIREISDKLELEINTLLGIVNKYTCFNDVRVTISLDYNSNLNSIYFARNRLHSHLKELADYKSILKSGETGELKL